MSTTWWSWTFTMPADALTFTAPRFVRDLPDAISKVLDREEFLSAHSENDFLHHWLAKIAQRFGRGVLDDFLMLDPYAAEGATRPATGFIDGWSIAALLPADIPAVETALDHWLDDPAALAAAFKGLIDRGDDVAGVIARLRAKPDPDARGGNLDDSIEDILWFVVRVRDVLAKARQRGEAVVHVRWLYL